MAAAAAFLPTNTVWSCGFFDCRTGSVPYLPLHLIACNFELLLVVFTVVLLRDWPVGMNVYVFDLQLDGHPVRFRVSAHPSQTFFSLFPLVGWEEDGLYPTHPRPRCTSFVRVLPSAAGSTSREGIRKTPTRP